MKTTGNEITAKIPLKTSTVKQTTTKSAISSETKTTTAVATIPKKQTIVKTKTVTFPTSRQTTTIKETREKPTTKIL